MSNIHTADVIRDSPASSAESPDCPRRPSRSLLPGSKLRVPAVWAPRRCLNSVTDTRDEKRIHRKQKTISFHSPCPEWCHRAWHWATRSRRSESSYRVWPVGVSSGHNVSADRSHPRPTRSTPRLQNRQDSTECTWNVWRFTKIILKKNKQIFIQDTVAKFANFLKSFASFTFWPHAC